MELLSLLEVVIMSGMLACFKPHLLGCAHIPEHPKNKWVAHCFFDNMIRSVVEPFPRETTGDLIGKKNKDYFILINAYPIQTSKRGPSTVYYGNLKAVKRLRDIDKAINKFGGLGIRIIGGYHSHTRIFEGLTPICLGKEDIDFVKSEMKSFNKKYWLEMVLGVKSNEYKKRKKIGEKTREFKKKLEVFLYDSEFHSYRILFSAYLVKDKKKLQIKELKVKRRRIKVRKC